MPEPLDLDHITSSPAQHVGAWLEQPDEGSAGGKGTDRLGALRDTIGASANSATLKEFLGATRTILACQRREATDEIGVACCELWMTLEARPPPK